MACWRACIVVVLGIVIADVQAASVYRCATPSGKVAFQQTPCDTGATQEIVGTRDTPLSPSAAAPAQPANGCAPGEMAVRIVSAGVAAAAVAPQGAMPANGGVSAMQGAPQAAIIGHDSNGQLTYTNPPVTRCMPNPNAPAARPAPVTVQGPPPTRLAGQVFPTAPPEKPADDTTLIARLAAATPEATASAQELGRRGSARALQSLVQRKAADLLAAYVRGFNEEASRSFGPPKALTPEIEQVLVGHVDDPFVGKPLALLVRSRAYRSRALFDRLYAHIAERAGPDAGTSWVSLVISTDLAGIDAPLVDALPKLEVGEQRLLFEFLSGRHSNAAVPAIVRWLDEGRATEDAYRWLQAIGTPDAGRVLVARLASYEAPLTEATRRGELALLMALMHLPPEALENVAAVAAKVPHQDDAEIRRSYVGLLAAHPDSRTWPQLVALLDDEKLRQAALEGLLASDSAEAWQAARQKIEGLKPSLVPGIYQYATQGLSRQLDHPDDTRKQHARERLSAKYEAERTALLKPYYWLAETRRDDPAQYVTLAAEKIDAMEKLAARYPTLELTVGLRGDTDRERQQIASTLRFTLRRPREAIQAWLATSPAGIGFAEVWAADTYRFDLADRTSAVSHYRKALEAIDAAGRRDPQAEGLTAWMKKWLGCEIAYLEGGQTFKGPLTREDLGAMFVLMIGNAMDLPPALATFASGEAPRDRPYADAAREAMPILRALPVSQAQAGLVLMLAPAFRDASELLEFLEKRDPAHYLSASLLGGIEAMKAQGGAEAGMPGGLAAAVPVLAAAGKTFSARTQIAFGVAPNAKFSSPEATWQAYLAALRHGDRAGALACFTRSALKQSLQGLFAKMSDAELAKLADDFSPIYPPKDAPADGEFREYGVVRTSSRQAGFIEFINAGGEWLIESM